ncbi:MAG: hypothetical protein WD490_06800 [Opitutales bacterium]
MIVEATSTPEDADSWSEDGATVLLDDESVLKVRSNTPVTGDTRAFLRLNVSHPSLTGAMSVEIQE